MSNTIYVHDTDPAAFALRVRGHLRERHRVELLWMRPQADGTVFCLAKLHRSFWGGLLWWLATVGPSPAPPSARPGQEAAA